MNRKFGTIFAAILATLAMGGLVAGCGSDDEKTDPAAMEQEIRQSVTDTLSDPDVAKDPDKVIDAVQQAAENAGADSDEVSEAMERARKALEALKEGAQGQE